MYVVITLAGNSRRFASAGYALPKFLISIDEYTMIEHVLDMFDINDNFIFVLNQQQVNQHPDLTNFLTSLVKKSEVVIIEPHELGPVHSALQIASIPDNAPLIISYCDFIVSWDYKLFLRQISNYDAAIPAFKGFHPASFGDTHYAYMRVNSQNEMLELSEKKSFTPERHQEWASAGVYYFKSWSIFKYYGNLLITIGFGVLKEAYVSLLANLMVTDNLKIKVTEVEHFICLGTPEDLEQYKFWSTYFNQPSQVKSEILDTNNQINIIPMAGKGSRFKEYGYRTSKALIQVRNQPMIVRSCQSFPAAELWVFLAREDDLNKHPIAKTLKNIYPSCVIMPVKYDTTGQAATCLLAKSELINNTPLFIASCDYETRFSQHKWQTLINDQSIDGVVWTCRIGANLVKNPLAFAYCVCAEDGRTITKIVEKNVISDNPEKDPLVVGSFWFRHSHDFVHAAETIIQRNIQINGEHYVGNSINILLSEGKKFVIFDIDQWISFGDPFELQIYNYWEEFFEKYALIKTPKDLNYALEVS